MLELMEMAGKQGGTRRSMTVLVELLELARKLQQQNRLTTAAQI
jgi:hypothetical protein